MEVKALLSLVAVDWKKQYQLEKLPLNTKTISEL